VIEEAFVALIKDILGDKILADKAVDRK